MTYVFLKSELFAHHLQGNMSTPFPSNGPGTEPEFDGYSLVLLKEIWTPPEALENNIDRLGKELESQSQLSSSLQLEPWKIRSDTPLGQMLTEEALMTWDYDLFKLKELSDGHPLVFLSYGFIRMFGLIEKLNLDEATLYR